MLSFKPTFSLSTFTFIKGLFSSSSLSATKVVSSAYLKSVTCCDGRRRSESERLSPSLEEEGGQEELPHVQGAAAARAQEGREELLHVQGQEGQP